MKHVKLFEDFILESVEEKEAKAILQDLLGEYDPWELDAMTEKEAEETVDGYGHKGSKAKKIAKILFDLASSGTFEAKVNEGFYSAKDIKKLKEFAEKVSSEIMDAYEDDFDRKSKNINADDYTPKQMFDYISNWGKGNDMKADDVIDEYDWESFTQELGLETYRG